ncbi:MAG TPA: DUF998 domain-containing protein [Gemmatimonadales bacterium]|nr:DUF998 domain-containing protein [Gemmatimonadales bacterium]
MADTRALVRAGAIAGPLYLLVGYAQAFTRDGFDLSRHALSQLANGDLGWIQTLNFAVSGLLVIAGAIGVRRMLRGTRGGTWGPILFALCGLGMMAASVFPADPSPGFPPGTPDTVTITPRGMMHFLFGAVTFYSLIAACFVFSRRFFSLGDRGWGIASLLVGLFFFLSFSSLATGMVNAWTMYTLYVAVTAALLWHSAVHRKVGNLVTTSA